METPSKEIGCSEFTKMLQSKVKSLLVRSYIALGRSNQLPDDEILDIESLEIAKILDPTVPLDRLEEVYLLAMRAKINTFGLSGVELNAAWAQIKGDEYRPKPVKCFGCEAEKESNGELTCPFHKGDNKNYVKRNQ